MRVIWVESRPFGGAGRNDLDLNGPILISIANGH